MQEKYYNYYKLVFPHLFLQLNTGWIINRPLGTDMNKVSVLSSQLELL